MHDAEPGLLCTKEGSMVLSGALGCSDVALILGIWRHKEMADVFAGFPAAASGVGVPVDPALLPFQTPYHRAGIEMRGGPALSGSPLDSSLLSELLQQLTRHNEDQGWHSRNDL
jgi:hypothetical protein